MTDARGLDDSGGRVVERRGPSVPHRAPFRLRFADGAGLELGRRTAVMGVVNVTPDSFSDGGRTLDPARARDVALALVEQGADLIDVGGESTRPGAAAVDEAEEIRRVVPAIAAIRGQTRARISVDTMKAGVARRALDAGADMLNDVSALADPEMLPLVAERGVPVVLLHMRGTPETMQRDTAYGDVVATALDFLRRRAERAVEAGVADDRIVVDPGIGFGKSTAGNLEILRRLHEFVALGRPMLIGASRKSFIGAVLDVGLDDRLEGSLAVAAWAISRGAHVVRVHDVRATVRLARMIDAIHEA